MKITGFIFSVVFVMGCFLGLTTGAPLYAQHSDDRQHAAGAYYCPMHPTYTSDKPGDCPICNMKLVPRRQESSSDTAKASDNGFVLTPGKQQLIGVKIDSAAYRAMLKQITSAGTVAFDPELYAAQQEYIEAMHALERVRESDEGTVISRAKALVEAGALKLRLLGLGNEQIAELGAAGTNDVSLLLPMDDAAGAWVYAPLYEYDLPWVQPGTQARISVVALAGREFTGTIVSIDPVLDAATRSARARIRVDNAAGLLKPQMYATVRMSVDLGARLSVPREAVMDTGKRSIVFLALDAGRFKPVTVTTGVSDDTYVEVLSGLKEGDRVAVSGNFLLDSESKLKSALEDTGHQHGQ